MKLLSIEFRNIGPYGNKLQTINFDNNGKLVLLQGKSGDGKSTLLALPSLLLYGQIPNRAKTGIANRVNRNGYIRGTIIEGNDEYVIERKFQPNSVTILKNGQDLDKIGLKDSQEYIDNNIVKMPMKIFCNIISLSMVDFKSFLNMNAEDRRQIIDRVFSLEMINSVLAVIKKDITETGKALQADANRIHAFNQTLTQANQELLRLSQQNTDNNQTQIEACNKTIEEETKKIEELNKKYKEASDSYNAENQQYMKFNETKSKIMTAYNMLNEKLALYNQGNCPTCGASFKGENFDNVKVELETKLKQAQEMLNKEIEEQQKVYQRMQNLSQASQLISNAVYQSQTTINTAKNKICVLNESMKQNVEFNSIQNIINSTSESLREVEAQQIKDSLLWDELNTLSTIYTNDGIKKQIMKNYIPHLNKEINKCLESMDFPYKLIFNEGFNAKLYHLGQEIGVDTLSVGEHKRVDLAVVCSIFKLIRKKYPSINIFNLDEVLSSIDTLTASLILSYLKEYAAELKLNIYVVSHVDMEENLFDESIRVYKEMGFSDIKFNNE